MSVKKSQHKLSAPIAIAIGVCLVLIFILYCLNFTNLFSKTYRAVADGLKFVEPPRVLDRVDYDRRMLILKTASSTIDFEVASSTFTSTATTGVTTTSTGISNATIYPNVDAILPFYRIIAYYGNFLSTKMGVLGQYPEAEMLSRLRAEIKNWEEADPTTPVMPAIDYIAVTAQGSAGKDGKYRLQMPDVEIEKALELAKQVNGIVILEIQAGLSTLDVEIPELEKYLKLPQVHLALDPEFYMKKGNRPGSVIGTMDAEDINYAINYLAKIVKENNLPPKVLVVHRFTSAMVTNSKKITPLPEVQVVMDMDGWGSPARKNTTYTKIVAPEFVQFTGFKLFYKNDILPPSTRLMSMEEVLKLKPRPIFIQYQ